MTSPTGFRQRSRARIGFRFGGAALVLALSSILGACSDTQGPVPFTAVPTTLQVLEGHLVQAPAGTVLPEGPTVRVLDQNGDPMFEEWVTFEVIDGGGSTPVSSRRTDRNGQARVPWILGREVGTDQTLRATSRLLSTQIEATTVAAVPGQTYYGRNQYTEYLPGDLPLVLSAAHGGYLTPDEIPDRTYGTMVQDRNTQELARQVRDAIKDQTGHYPHIIISRLHRTKLDPNREIAEAAQGDPEAERAWHEFQTYIDEAERIVEETYGEGFYIDLHGHGHDIQRLELGYLLSSDDLANTDETLSEASFVNKSSVKAVAQKPGVTLPTIIRGPNSLGSLMEAAGIPSVPSQNQPDPGSNPFFSGGYNTAMHGSRDGGSVSGVQIECNYTGVRDTEENRDAFAEALGNAMAAFFQEFLNIPLAPLPGSGRE